jgi:hypothetical protein
VQCAAPHRSFGPRSDEQRASATTTFNKKQQKHLLGRAFDAKTLPVSPRLTTPYDMLITCGFSLRCLHFPSDVCNPSLRCLHLFPQMSAFFPQMSAFFPQMSAPSSLRCLHFSLRCLYVFGIILLVHRILLPVYSHDFRQMYKLDESRCYRARGFYLGYRWGLPQSLSLRVVENANRRRYPSRACSVRSRGAPRVPFSCFVLASIMALCVVRSEP